jgi:hypothetical protein
MNSRYQPSEQHSRQSSIGPHILVLAAVFGMGTFNELSMSAWADQTSTAQFDSSNSGQITAVGSTSLEVEQRIYRLDPKLEIRNETGQPMDLPQLKVGMGVRLQLKEGAVFKIMVLNPK